jgi:hypothetical protein
MTTKLPKIKTRAVRDLHASGHTNAEIAKLLDLTVADVSAVLSGAPKKASKPQAVEPAKPIPRGGTHVRIGDGSATVFADGGAIIHAGPGRDAMGMGSVPSRRVW